MLALVKVQPGPGQLVLERARQLWEPGPGEVRVRVRAAGICGTDLNIYRWPPSWQARAARMPFPVVLGHEVCGFVEAVGENVEGLRVGQFVSLESHLPCGRCATCRAGRPHVCEELRHVGVEMDGGFAQWVVVPAPLARPVPAAWPAEVAAQLEPFGMAVRAVLGSGGVVGRSVWVSGCGPLGLMSVAAARAGGAAGIVVSEVHPYRLRMARELAAELGIDRIIDAACEPVAEAVREATGGRGVEVWIDFSGAPQALQQGLEALAPGGEARWVAGPPQPVCLELEPALRREIRIQTLHGRELFATWDQALRLLAERPDLVGVLQRLVTHVVPLERYDEALEVLLAGQAGKVLLVPPEWDAG